MKPNLASLPILAACFASPAVAQMPAPAGEPAAGRYQFQPVEGGLARLDTATGEIAICRVDPVHLACDLGPAAPAAGPAAAPSRPPADGADDAEFDRALGRMKRALRAFGDIARDFEDNAPPATPVPNRT